MKEPKELRDYGLSGGDIGIIAIAAVFALCGLYLMVGPSPFGDYFTKKHEQPQQVQQQQKEAAEPQEDGVVTVGIAPEGKPQL
jgi:hypothetical protein